mgnify:CR=1 FL=1
MDEQKPKFLGSLMKKFARPEEQKMAKSEETVTEVRTEVAPEPASIQEIPVEAAVETAELVSDVVAEPVDTTPEGEPLPFPRARVVSIMREEIKDKIIRSEVKEAMNLWLGNLLKRIAREMSNTQYGSVGIADFQRATKPYDMIEDIVKDEQRLLTTTEKLKADSDHIMRELQRFFAVIKGKRPEEQKV